MPFFVLLSGASASFWAAGITNGGDSRSTVKRLAHRIRSAAKYLILPFFAWTLLSYLVDDYEVGFWDYIISVLQRVDMALWFLPVIFWCTTFLVLGLALFHQIQKHTEDDFKYQIVFDRLDVRLLSILLIWLLIRTKMPNFFGIGMTNFFQGGLFFYFLIGVYLQCNKEKFQKFRYSLFSLLVFATLVPFWSRIEANNFTQNVPEKLNTYYVGAIFTVLVATSGSCAAYLLGRKIFDTAQLKFLSVFSLLGTYSLGIYALHSRFIFLNPYVLAPAACSLVLSVIFYRTPVINTIFFGQKRSDRE
jgi:hypothetical protein